MDGCRRRAHYFATLNQHRDGEPAASASDAHPYDLEHALLTVMAHRLSHNFGRHSAQQSIGVVHATIFGPVVVMQHFTLRKLAVHPRDMWLRGFSGLDTSVLTVSSTSNYRINVADVARSHALVS